MQNKTRRDFPEQAKYSRSLIRWAPNQTPRDSVLVVRDYQRLWCVPKNSQGVLVW